MTAPSSTKRHRILIVDDNAAIHEDFRKILSDTRTANAALQAAEATLFGTSKPAARGQSFEVDYASQGEEALALVRRGLAENRPYSLAFIDGRMPPGWDGIETISHIWREYPDLQVVFCTAYSDYSWEAIRQALGDTDSMVILKKPFDNVEVLQLAHTLVRKWELNRQVKARLDALDEEVRERTAQREEAVALFEGAFAQSPTGILIADVPDVKIRWANAADEDT